MKKEEEDMKKANEAEKERRRTSWTSAPIEVVFQ